MSHNHIDMNWKRTKESDKAALVCSTDSKAIALYMLTYRIQRRRRTQTKWISSSVVGRADGCLQLTAGATLLFLNCECLAKKAVPQQL